VDLVFIDPPYNTGNEGWCYSDNVNSPIMKEWLSTNPVDGEDMLRHDKWLCMMWPRLVLLRAILDEIFGEQNFLATVVWQKKQSPQNDATNFSDMHDYLIVYAKHAKKNRDDLSGWQRNLVSVSEGQLARYSNPDNDSRGNWTDSDYTCNKTADERPNLFYSIANPHTGEDVWPERKRVWSFDRESHQRNVKEGLIWWPSSRDKPRLKV
jgi:adenine-specific DNA-methyltransferase